MKQFLKMIADDWPKYASRPGRNEFSLEDLSFDAWVKQYKPSENFVNRGASYYEKGFWTAMALDVELRVASGGKAGLTDLFRILWDRFGRAERPIADGDVRAAAAEIAGKPMDGFFDKYVRGTEDLRLPEFLQRAGVAVDARPEWDESARAAGDRDPVRSARARAWAGLTLAPDKTTIRNVVPGSPAWKAGLTFSDDIVAVAGLRVNATTLPKRLADHAPGPARRDRVLPARRAAHDRADAGGEARSAAWPSPWTPTPARAPAPCAWAGSAPKSARRALP